MDARASYNLLEKRKIEDNWEYLCQTDKYDDNGIENLFSWLRDRESTNIFYTMLSVQYIRIQSSV